MSSDQIAALTTDQVVALSTTQVGLLTTMGLAAKNAILIVEFAKDLHEKGMGLIEATLEAVRIRLRPIIMTSLAFIFGVLPLAGDGSGLRQPVHAQDLALGALSAAAAV